MRPWECDSCGLAAVDLPDGIDPEFIFDWCEECSLLLCQGCLNNHACYELVLVDLEPVTESDEW